jgi:hypothetical protein
VISRYIPDGRDLISPKVYNQKAMTPDTPKPDGTGSGKTLAGESACPTGCSERIVFCLAYHGPNQRPARRAERLGICPVEVVNEVLARLAPLLGY